MKNIIRIDRIYSKVKYLFISLKKNISSLYI